MSAISFRPECVNTLRPRQNGHRFGEDILKCIFLNENMWISITISLKFVPNGPINNVPALFQIMAWRRPGDKPLSEPMMVNLLTHICVTLSHWVKSFCPGWTKQRWSRVTNVCLQVRCKHLGEVPTIQRTFSFLFWNLPMGQNIVVTINSD